jgi:predicted O-methyltransferase YrrM
MKKQLLAKVGRRIARPVRLYTLWQSRDPYLQLFASSAQAALSGALTLEEKAWTSRIERLRSELESSTEKVTRTDFGAGLRHAADAAPAGAEGSLAGARVEDEVQRIARFSSKKGVWAVLLFKLIRELRPLRCVEMGTALGLSGAYQAAALALNGRGKLTSLEGSAELAALARRNWAALGLEGADVVVGKFSDTLGGVIGAQSPIDYVFVDGHHDENATLDYFEQLIPHLASPACLVFDDIAWSAGMQRAWRTIANDHRVKVSVDFGMMGVAIAGSAEKHPPRRAPLL